MGAVPHHPFFTLVIESLIPYDKNWGLPYITVMSSTGPLFLSVIWQHYKRGRGRGLSELSSAITTAAGTPGGANAQGRWDGTETGRVRVLMGDEYNQKPWSFFRWHGGSSWHGSDARFIFWMGRHWMLLTASGFLLAGIVGLGLWWAYGRVLLLGERRRRGGGAVGASFCGIFLAAKKGENTGACEKSTPGGWTDKISLFRARSADYELAERHEV